MPPTACAHRLRRGPSCSPVSCTCSPPATTRPQLHRSLGTGTSARPLHSWRARSSECPGGGAPPPATRADASRSKRQRAGGMPRWQRAGAESACVCACAARPHHAHVDPMRAPWGPHAAFMRLACGHHACITTGPWHDPMRAPMRPSSGSHADPMATPQRARGVTPCGRAGCASSRCAGARSCQRQRRRTARWCAGGGEWAPTRLPRPLPATRTRPASPRRCRRTSLAAMPAAHPPALSNHLPLGHPPVTLLSPSGHPAVTPAPVGPVPPG